MGSGLADLFISYWMRDGDRTRTLADALIAEGVTVWWDTELDAYATFGGRIDAALVQARVVVWSEGAGASDYVVAEVRAALVNVRLVNTVASGFAPRSISKAVG